MSEPVVAPVQISAEPTTEVKVEIKDPFAQSAWVETPVQEVKVEEKKEDTIKDEIKIETKVETVVEPFYKKLGLEKDEDVITEITTLREKVSKVPEEIKFENEESKTIHELLREGKPENKKAVKEYLQTQDQLEELSSLQVNKENAVDIIKLQIRLKNPQLSTQDVDFEYKQNYGVPKEPVQKTTEDDDDFNERHAEWKEQADSIERRREIAAKIAQPELAKLKTELKLPQTEKPKVEMANEPDPAAIQQIRDSFLNKLESDYSKADGFSTQVKDESVEIPVAFKIPDEDKVAIKKVLENNFDVDQYISSRWFGEKGEPRIEQIVSDIYLLDNLDKVLSGIANNSANQRLVQYRKEVANIDVNGKTHQQTFQPNADGKSTISPFSQGAWSEKPPVSINN